MTCLYCGKKLGFFSRFKDTPFCSEEHLRVHQDELERALMERLGSKSVAPARSLESLANEAPPPKSKMGLESPRAMDPVAKASSKESLKESKKAREIKAAPPPAPEPAVKETAAPPPPLCEDYIIERPASRPDLDTSLPLIPPSSFAIIVQADCCTPYSPEPVLYPGFPMDDTGFEIDTTSLLNNCTFAPPELPTLYEESDFGKDLIRLPVSVSAEAKFDFALFGDIVPLEYDAANSTLRQNMLGRRDELEPRIRFRYPYAASEVSSSSKGLPLTDENYSLSDSSDWDPILPAPCSLPQMEEPLATQHELAPQLDVPLSKHALANFSLNRAEPQDTSDALIGFALALPHTDGLSTNCSSSSWAANTILPGPATTRRPRSIWQPTRSTDRVPPIPFPSLFQLGPVLPPRPESVAG